MSDASAEPLPNVHGDTVPPPAVSLPCALPVRYPTEPNELTAFRRNTADEKEFATLRRAFRDAEDWRALATVLVLHAAALQDRASLRTKAGELSLQSYELWIERVKDRETAAAVLARAVQLAPDNVRAQARLRKLYESLGAYKELATLLRWRLAANPTSRDAAGLHLELAELLEEQFVAVGEAVQHYEQALLLEPTNMIASERLIGLYRQAGAWRRCSELMSGVLERLDVTRERHRVAEYHRRLAGIEFDRMHDVAAAARHLQAALKAVPDDVEALQAFGALYLSSGKSDDDGVTKAADIFYKAAEIARRRGTKDRALKLLRRCLNLLPEHSQASAALENTLIDAEDWLALDELYREWLYHYAGEEAVPLQLRRAELLDDRLHRREEARQLYEEAIRYQPPGGDAWDRLRRIYEESKDFHALASLFDAQLDQAPDETSTETLLRAASVYRDELGLEERAAVYFYKVLEREPFNTVAFEGYKEHWRRKHNWAHLRDLLLYQIEQASDYEDEHSPLSDPAFAEEFVELADICERRLGDIDGALDAWGRLVAVYPSDPRPQKHIARIEKRARMWDNMVRVQEAELERAVDPAKRLDILKRLTQVYRDRQVNPERAIELYNEILELSPNDVQATRALTALYDRAGDFPQVVEMLREQYERSRSNTERTSLLRRLAELWHHELDSPDEALWACEEILAQAPNDREAMYRLQQILEEQEQFEQLYEVLERELAETQSKEGRAKIMRRMARLAEHALGDDDRAARLWTDLDDQRHSLELLDKRVFLYERSGRYEELGTLLQKGAQGAETPLPRQIDYLLRLGQLAESHLDDPELARTSFESVLRSRPDHRGALEALVRLYRRDESWQPLVAVLGKLQELAETEEDEFRIAWERAELLSEQQNDAEGAAEILESLGDGPAVGNREVASTRLELYERSEQWNKLVRQAEVVLLSTDEAAERRRLYEQIADTWRDRMDDTRAALAAYTRFVEEFSGDLDALWRLSGLQLEVADPEAALGSLARRLALAPEVEMRTSTLEAMSEIAEDQLANGARAMEYLRQALEFDNFHREITQKLRDIASKYELWTALLRVHEERFGYADQAEALELQIEIATEASSVAETERADAPEAFRWAARGYFVAIGHELPASDLLSTLERLAEQHDLWASLVTVIEEEIEHYEDRGAVHSGSYDAVSRLLAASEITEEHLDDPQRAVGFLQRAHRLRPRDEELATRLEDTARRYRLWQAVIELHGGHLERAVTDLGRFDACVAIAKVYEEELGDPEQAFGWIEKAVRDLAPSDKRLSAEAFDRMTDLVERHTLWRHLAKHHLTTATTADAADDVLTQLDALRAAATVLHERLSDPLGASRILSVALGADPSQTQLLDQIRDLAEEVDDKRDGDLPPIGALSLLGVLQRLYLDTTDAERRQALLIERAQVRETRMDDPVGAMAEWFRVLHRDSDNDEALVEAERIAEENDLWQAFLVQPAQLLEQARDTQARARQYKRLARLYEGPLQRSEYALRARLASWKLSPELPPTVGDLDADQAAIWRLAEQTGGYARPPVPKDPHLTPTLAAPELADLRQWARAGIDPRALEALPDPFAPKVEIAAPSATDAVHTEEVSVSALAPADPGVPTSTTPTGTQEVDIEELDFDELQIEELEEIDEPPATSDDEHTVASATGIPDPAATPDATHAQAVSTAKPPPPPRSPSVGLPPIPKLTRPILPARPKVSSAWEEVALAYADVPTSGRAEQATTALVLARLWEEGAGDLERAFRAHERALVWVPEAPESLESLRALAERHAEEDRLQQAYELLLAEAALPDHIVAMGMRLARLHESRDDDDQAEVSFRGVLEISPTHRDALRSLCRIYESTERWSDYVTVFADLLEAENEELETDERIDRTLELARILAEELGRKKEASDRLELLVRQHAGFQRVHDAHVDLLIEMRQWQPAIEAMRVGADAVGDEEYRLGTLARVAVIYEQKLGLPDRAISAWAEIADHHDDAEALAKLQQLYLDTARMEPALPIIERRLELLAATHPGDKSARIALLVAKARVLQEGLGNDTEATQTLEQLLEEAPDNDDVAQGLSRLYRKQGRLEDGIALLRRRWDGVSRDGLSTEAEDQDATRRFVDLTVALATVLDEEGHDPKGGLGVIESALESLPGLPTLLRQKVHFSRALHDQERLADALAALGGPAELLEAADLYRALGDSAKALRLYSRVLAESKKDANDPGASRRLADALEGLVKLRVEDGDIHGALEFMDRQLAEMTGPAIRAQLLTDMGRIAYRSTGDVRQAQDRFDAALAEDPECARAKLGKAEVLFHSGAVGEAQRLLTDAVDALSLAARDSSELVEALVLLAEVLEAAGRAGEAYRRLTSAARHAPDNLEIRAGIVRNRLGAARYRDAVTAADHVEQQLAEGIERTPENNRLVSEVFAMAATAELEMRHEDAAIARYRRAIDIDPTNSAALEPLIRLAQERGDLLEAARYAATFARQAADPSARGRAYLEAGMLFHDAAAALADGAEFDEALTEADLRKAAFENLRLGLELAENDDELVLGRDQLEVAYRASAEHDPRIALRCLNGLLGHPELSPENRRDLLLEGVRVSLNADEGDALEHAERFAAEARELDPTFAPAVLAQARVLEATDRVAELEPLVEAYFAALDESPGAEEDIGTRVQLLLRLAELQESVPHKAVEALERAAALDPSALDASGRKHLASLYDSAEITGTKVLSNHIELLVHDPLFEPSLRALALHYARLEEFDRALGLYRVLSLLAPQDEHVRSFVEQHEEVGDALDGPADLPVTVPVPADAGVGAVLEQLWDNGGALLSEHLPKLDVPAEARVSPVGDTVLSHCWSDTIKKLQRSKVALIAAEGLSDAGRAPDGVQSSGYFEVRWQKTPLILASSQALECEDPAVLTFALGRAIYFSRSHAVFATGLCRDDFAHLLSATMQAFHPRHSRRKHHQQADSSVGKLAQELARKLPMKAARKISAEFKERAHESFSSAAWRAAIAKNGNRIGLALSGDLHAAVRVLAPGCEGAEALRRAVDEIDELRDLIAFAGSDSYAKARRSLGFQVQERSSASEPSPQSPA